MRVLGVPPLARDARRRLIDFPTVILATAAETVGGEAGALALFHPHLSCGEGEARNEQATSGPHRGELG